MLRLEAIWTSSQATGEGTMSLAVTGMGWSKKSSCKDGIAELGWSVGCLSWRAAKVVSSDGARVSSKLSIQTAPLNFSSLP